MKDLREKIDKILEELERAAAEVPWSSEHSDYEHWKKAVKKLELVKKTSRVDLENLFHSQIREIEKKIEALKLGKEANLRIEYPKSMGSVMFGNPYFHSIDDVLNLFKEKEGEG